MRARFEAPLAKLISNASNGDAAQLRKLRSILGLLTQEPPSAKFVGLKTLIAIEEQLTFHLQGFMAVANEPTSAAATPSLYLQTAFQRLQEVLQARAAQLPQERFLHMLHGTIGSAVAFVDRPPVDWPSAYPCGTAGAAPAMLPACDDRAGPLVVAAARGRSAPDAAMSNSRPARLWFEGATEEAGCWAGFKRIKLAVSEDDVDGLTSTGAVRNLYEIVLRELDDPWDTTLRFEARADLDAGDAETVHLWCRICAADLPPMPSVLVLVPLQYPDQPPRLDLGVWRPIPPAPFIDAVRASVSMHLAALVPPYSVSELLRILAEAVRAEARTSRA